MRTSVPEIYTTVHKSDGRTGYDLTVIESEIHGPRSAVRDLRFAIMITAKTWDGVHVRDTVRYRAAQHGIGSKERNRARWTYLRADLISLDVASLGGRQRGLAGEDLSG